VLLLVWALFLLSATLISCGKKAAAPPNPNAGQLTTQPAQSLYGRAAQHAVGVAGCQPNLEQIRETIQMYRDDHDGQNPPSLQDLGLPAKILRCPVSKQDYQYDPTTGRVWCTFPGHEQY
jgi:hypothetical protein